MRILALLALPLGKLYFLNFWLGIVNVLSWLVASCWDKVVSFECLSSGLWQKKSDVTTVGNAFPDNALLSAQAGHRDLAHCLESRLNYQPFGHFHVKCSLLWFSHS